MTLMEMPMIWNVDKVRIYHLNKKVYENYVPQCRPRHWGIGKYRYMGIEDFGIVIEESLSTNIVLEVRLKGE